MGQKRIWVIVGVIILALIVIKVIGTLSSRTPRISEQPIATEQILPAENILPVPDMSSNIPSAPEPTVASPAPTPRSAGVAVAETTMTNMPSAKEIQTALNNAGFNVGAIDGKMGKKTKAAIMEFQKVNDLIADGKVGPKTWSKLSKFLKAAPTLR